MKQMSLFKHVRKIDHSFFSKEKWEIMRNELNLFDIKPIAKYNLFKRALLAQLKAAIKVFWGIENRMLMIESCLKCLKKRKVDRYSGKCCDGQNGARCINEWTFLLKMDDFVFDSKQNIWRKIE